MNIPTIPRNGGRLRVLNSLNPELYLYESIGPGLFGGISSKDVTEQLAAWAAAGAPSVSVRINSPGGEVFEGLAIFNAMTRYPGPLTTYIDGAAWSIASVIAMAGQEVVMAANAQFMVHDPAAVLYGTAEDFRRIAGTLDATKDSLITAYQRQTNAGRDRLSEWMANETWFDAAEAAAAGFVTRIEESLPVAAYCPPAMRYRNMPKWVQDRVRPQCTHPPDLRRVQLERSKRKLDGLVLERTVTLR